MQEKGYMTESSFLQNTLTDLEHDKVYKYIPKKIGY